MLQSKTFNLAVQAIELVKGFPRGIAHEVVAKQFVRAATSTAANYGLADEVVAMALASRQTARRGSASTEEEQATG
jgi:hypothetical protein